MVAALIFSALVAFTLTPAVRVFAYKIGAIDVPKDTRRMHKKPIPRLGGLAIFIGFICASVAFCEPSPALMAIWFGGLVIVCAGILDDVISLHPLVKFAIQILVALIAVSQGMRIGFISIAGNTYSLGNWSIFITVVWIVGLTNAINLIDGLDGLSCGVSAICSLSLFMVTLLMADNTSALITAILAGACIGFLPFNSNPAKIFMGDTGALFLGYTLSVMSVNGLFKVHTIASFLIPMSIFALPLFDTAFAFIRRILHGKSPFSADRGHIHHKLIDMGFNQKQSVYILYSVCGILGIAAIMFTNENLFKAGFIIIVGLLIFAINYILLHNPISRVESGLELKEAEYHHIGSDAIPPNEARLLSGEDMQKVSTEMGIPHDVLTEDISVAESAIEADAEAHTDTENEKE